MTKEQGKRLRLSVWRQVLFLAILVTPVIVLSEVIVRLMREPPGFFPVNQLEAPLYMPDPIRGYTLKPLAHSDYVTPELDVDMDISADGIRDAPLATAREAGFRVLAVGDSFTMGLAVRQKDTWSEQLERLLNSKDRSKTAAVVNGGVPGYSPRQIRQQLEELLPKVEPNVVVFGFVTETFFRIKRPLQLFGGTLVRSDAIPKMRVTSSGILYSPYDHAWMRRIDFWLNQYWQFGAHVLVRVYRMMHGWDVSDWERVGLDPRVVRPYMQPALDELLAAARLADQARADFVVLLINLQDSGTSFGPRQAVYNQITMEYCRKNELSCVNLLPELEQRANGRPIFRTPSDQHWTPAAHSIAANALLRIIVDPH